MICSPTLYWNLYLQHLNFNLHSFIYIVLLHFPTEKRLHFSQVALSQLLGREPSIDKSEQDLKCH